MAKYKYPLLVGFLALLLMFFFYGKFLIHPNDYLMGFAPDCIKNYFTVAWYLKYDAGLHFTGMHYPYGSHMVFPDAHPILSIILNWVDDHLITLNGHAVGVINMLSLLSIPVCALFVFNILRHFKLEVGVAIIGSLFISFLSPQIARFFGHYSLSYAFFIPIIWWSLLKAKNSKKSVGIYIGINAFILFIGCIHAYFLPIGALFLMSYIVIEAWQESWRKVFHLETLSLLGLALVPIVFFQLMLKMTDPIVDRPEAVYGLFEYVSTIPSILFPKHGFFGDFLRPKLSYRIPAQMEGDIYWGLVGTITLLVFLIRIALVKWKGFKPVKIPKSMIPGLWAGIFLGIFSTSILFQIFTFIPEYIKPIRQFRSLGRFGWALYYPFTVFVIFYLNEVIRKIQSRNLKWSAVGMICIIWTLDILSFNFHHYKHFTLINVKNDYFSGRSDVYQKSLVDFGYKSSDFQGILGLPFTNPGNSKTDRYPSGEGEIQGMKCAYQTGIPLFNSHFKTSISQCLKIEQLIAHPWIKKEILEELPSDQSILLLVSDLPKLHPNEKELINKAKWITTLPKASLFELDVSLYELPLNALRQDFSSDSLIKLGLEPKDFFHQNSFEKETDNDALFGNGAFHAKQKSSILDTLSIPNSIIGEEMEVSIWGEVDQRNLSMPSLQVKVTDKNGGHLFSKMDLISNGMDFYKGWARGNLQFKLPLNAAFLVIELSNPSPEDYYLLDELQVRLLNDTVSIPLPESNGWLVNNYFISNN